VAVSLFALVMLLCAWPLIAQSGHPSLRHACLLLSQSGRNWISVLLDLLAPVKLSSRNICEVLVIGRASSVDPSQSASLAATLERLLAPNDSRRFTFIPHLFHGDLCAGCAVQQSFQVKAGKLIIGIFADMPGEGRDCACVARFQFGECFEITLCRRKVVLFWRQGLESAKRIRTPPQQKVADRSATEILGFRRDGRADASAGPELLVGNFQPRGDVDGVAIGGVVEEAAAAEITNDRRASMHSDPRNAQPDVIFLPARAE
jgi:hypothetical protein